MSSTMATNGTKKNIRISVKPQKCPNPLFQKWLQEWKTEAESKGSDMQFCFGKALKSLQKYPLVLKSGKECGVLDYFGNRLCIMLDRRLAEYKKEHPEGIETAIKNDFPVAASSHHESNKVDPKPRKRKSDSNVSNATPKPNNTKRNRAYVPAWRSGPYALLLTLLDSSQKPDYPGHLTKSQLQNMAQPLCDTSFKRPDPGSHYTAWSSMAGLVKKGLVLRSSNPAKFTLSDAGIALAVQLQEVSGGSKSTSPPDPGSSVSIELSDDEDSCPNPSISIHTDSVPYTTGVISSICVQSNSSSKLTLLESGSVFSTGTVSSTCVQSSSSSKSTTPFESGLACITKAVGIGSQKNVRKSPQKKRNKPPDTLAEEETIILVPGSFDVILLVDKAETSGGKIPKLMEQDETVKELSTTGAIFELRHLKVGDYTWICRDRNSGAELVLPYVVERKRMDDLAKSIKDGRYHEQKFRLKRCGIQNLIYLIESHGDNTHTTIPLQSLQQAAVNTQVIDRFTVKYTSGRRDSVRYLATMTNLLSKLYNAKTVVGCRRENLPKSSIADDLVSLMRFSEFNNCSSKRKVLGTRSMFIKQLIQLNGLSVPKAQAIVNKYSSPRLLIAAYQEAGREGEKLLAGLRYGTMNRMIGPVISKAIYQLYTHYHLS